MLLILILIVILILGEDLESKTQKKNKNNTPNLSSMIKKASDESLSDEELKALAELFIATHKLGSKTQNALSEETKEKLEFVSAFAANSKASASSIGFLNAGLKKISNSYAKDIDAYEQMGLSKRKAKA